MEDFGAQGVREASYTKASILVMWVQNVVLLERNFRCFVLYMQEMYSAVKLSQSEEIQFLFCSEYISHLNERFWNKFLLRDKLVFVLLLNSYV